MKFIGDYGVGEEMWNKNLVGLVASCVLVTLFNEVVVVLDEEQTIFLFARLQYLIGLV